MFCPTILVLRLVSPLRKYRQLGFKSTTFTAKKIAQEIKILAQFQRPRMSKRKTHFEEKAEHENDLLRKFPNG